MPRFDHFSLLAPFYDRVFGALACPARLCELLALPAARLLDVGGGTGRVASSLVDQVGQVILADPSRGMLAQSRNKPKLGRVRARAERLPFPDGAFDRVLVVDAFHHFEDHRVAVTELLRILAPGGRLVLQEINVEQGPAKVVALVEHLVLMGSRFYGPADFHRLFARTDARVTVEVEGPWDLYALVEKA